MCPGCRIDHRTLPHLMADLSVSLHSRELTYTTSLRKNQPLETISTTMFSLSGPAFINSNKRQKNQQIVVVDADFVTFAAVY